MVLVNKTAPKAKHAAASVLDVWYAHVMVRWSMDDRLTAYRKISALLRNRFSLMDALERMFQIASKDGKNPGDTMAVAVAAWMKSVQNGDPFSVALRGWAPASEVLMLSVGDISNLEMALDNTIRVVEGMRKMREAVWGALSYPLVLLLMVAFLVWGVAKFLVPPMKDAVPNLIWKGTAKTVVDLSVFVDKHPIFLASIFPVLLILTVVSFPRWKSGMRRFFDKVPPWSIYRIFVGVGWLLSLSALIKAGTPVSKAMRALRSDASPYLLYRIDRSLFYVNNGDNLGDALYHTKQGFPDDEVVGDLRIYAELDNFPDALDRLSNDWLQSSLSDIEKKAGILNGVAILLIAGFVAWTVFGTFDMQNQMVSGMGLGGG